MPDGTLAGAEAHAAPLSEAASQVAGRLRRPALAPISIAFVAVCLDLPVFAVAVWFAQYAATPTADFDPLQATALAVATAAVASGVLAVTGGYAMRSRCRAPAALVHGSLALVVPAIALLADDIPVGRLMPSVTLAALAAIVPTRLVGAAAMRWVLDVGLVGRRAVIAGGGENAARLIRGLLARHGSDIRICGIFDDRDDARSPQQVLGVPKIGGYDDLIGFARAAEIDMVIVTLPLRAEARINWLLDRLRVLPTEVRLSAYSGDFAFRNDGGDPLIAAIRRSFAPERRLTKRAFDLVFASLALLLLSPVMLAAALAVKLDSPGPVFFRQRRHGYNDRVIDVLKFRSMHHDACDPAAARIVTRGDPRVTRVGRFLRRSSIDELPQLFNVLTGQLSLVGPRPHAVAARSSAQEPFDRIVEGYSARHRLPPGITGWAQIHGWRGEVDDADKLHARFEHDLYYIENWSLWLDLAILIRTPLSLLDTRSAY